MTFTGIGPGRWGGRSLPRSMRPRGGGRGG